MNLEHPAISIVTTFRNEQQNLEELIRRIQGSLKDFPSEYEILFVDDHSTDKSLEILKAHATRDKRIKILVTSRRFGVYECLFAGLEHATGEAVIYLESDLQDPPELIPILIDKWNSENADIVHTTRKERLGESWLKMKLTAIAYRIINWASEVSIPINTGDYKLISRRALTYVLMLKEHDPYYRGLIAWVGFNQSHVYFTRHPRFSGKSQRGLLSFAPLKVFLSAITSFSNYPLFSAFMVSLLFFASSILFIGIGVMTTSRHTPNGWLIVGVFGIMMAIILLFLGIQNLYIARIFRQVRGRPSYIIQEKINL